MKPDIIKEAKMTYDEKYKLLRLAKKNNIVLDLRKETWVPWGRYYVTASAPMQAGKSFLTGYFASRYFNKLVEKHGLDEVKK